MIIQGGSAEKEAVRDGGGGGGGLWRGVESSPMLMIMFLGFSYRA